MRLDFNSTSKANSMRDDCLSPYMKLSKIKREVYKKTSDPTISSSTHNGEIWALIPY